ncbi:hypothetical protein [Deinococcus multiflagellatus]|uniref:Uncharacterized protein n=1 Tax=Deinococcus multiflagellatus TaxID=1656887 RepID=A0ABW1ZPE8_9DEIO|nr:hypothetical protein [Deinococcus multiflagellatus]MBZ9715603.1 hypothetical protein [Deinococcus multiflagellatus]
MTLDSAALIQRGGPYSLFEVKRILEISWSDLAWGVREGGFRHLVVDGRYFVEINSLLHFEHWSRSKRIAQALREELEAENFPEDEIKHQLELFEGPSAYNFISGWQPKEIQEYLEFHETINQFTWLLKVRYSPKRELRKRAMRLDSIFANYLRKNKVQLSRLQRLMPSEAPDSMRQQRASESLRKVWYNELAYLQPSPPDVMHIDMLGVSHNLERSQDRLLFLSWRVTQASVPDTFRQGLKNFG